MQLQLLWVQTAAGGLGDVSIQQVSNSVFNVFVLSTNNGFGAYRITITPSLAGDYYIGAPGTGPVKQSTVCYT